MENTNASLMSQESTLPEPQVSMDPTHSNFCDGVAAVCCGDDMYVYGGHAADRVWRLHMPTATWTEIQATGQIPLARFFHTCCYFRGYILMCGGEVLAGSKLSPSNNSMMYYELALDTHEWTAIDCFGDLPLSRSHHTATVCRDTMIVFGGKPTEGDTITNKRLVELKSQGFHDVFLLHIISRSWRRVEMYDSRAPMLWGHSACMYHDTHLLFFGGFDVSSSELQALDRHGSLVFEDDPPIATISNVTHILNVETMQFQRSTPLPSDIAPAPRAMHVGFSFGDEMIIFGGMTIDPFGRAILTNDCWIWEVVSGRWSRIDFALPQWQTSKLLSCAYYSQLVVANSLSYVFFLDNNRREMSWQRAPCSIQRLLVLDTLANRRFRNQQQHRGGALSNINEVFNPRLAVQVAKRAELVRGDTGHQNLAAFPGSLLHQGTAWGRAIPSLSSESTAASSKEIAELRQMIGELQMQLKAQEQLIASKNSQQQHQQQQPSPRVGRSAHTADDRPKRAADDGEFAAPPSVSNWDFVSPGHDTTPAATRSEAQQRVEVVSSKGVKRAAAATSKERPPVSGGSVAGGGEWPSPPARRPSPEIDRESSAAPQSVKKAPVAIRRSKASEHSTSPSDKRSSVSASTGAPLTTHSLPQNPATPATATQPQINAPATTQSPKKEVNPASTPPAARAAVRTKEWASQPALPSLESLAVDVADEEAAELARMAELGLRIHHQLHMSSESKRQLLKKERQDRIAQLQERLLALESLPLVSEDKKGRISHILEATQSLKTMIETGKDDGVADRHDDANSVDVEGGTAHFDPSSVSDLESAGPRTPPPEANPAESVVAAPAQPSSSGQLLPPAEGRIAVASSRGGSKLESVIQRRRASISSRQPTGLSVREGESQGESLRDHSKHREWSDNAHQPLGGGMELTISEPSSSSGAGVPRGAAVLAAKFDELNAVLQQQRSTARR